MLAGQGQMTPLQGLTEAFRRLQEQEPIVTKDFCDACCKLEPFFDHFGSLFHFAKSELVHKTETVVAVQSTSVTLHDVFVAEKKKGTHLHKNSPARNLHRLAITLEFIVHIFDNLAHDETQTLRQAVAAAYDATLSSIHYWAVRTAVKAGLYSLPTREHFFRSIEETEKSAVANGLELVRIARKVVERLHVIFAGENMPCSDVKFLPSFSAPTK